MGRAVMGFLSAFLQGKWLDRSVIVALPDGFGVSKGTVWRIKERVYGHNFGERPHIGAHVLAGDSENGFHYKGLHVSIVKKKTGIFEESFDIILDGNEYLDASLLMNAPAGDNDEILNASQAKIFGRLLDALAIWQLFFFAQTYPVESSFLGR